MCAMALLASSLNPNRHSQKMKRQGHQVSDLMRAVASRRAEEAAALLEESNVKSHLNDVDLHGNSVLNYACAMGLPEAIIQRMLELGADPKVKNNMGAGKFSSLSSST